MPATLTPQEFVARWRHATLSERASAQSHFIDVCRLLGHPTPAEADPAGVSFTFEAGATKQAGGQGWADVWKRHVFGWEYKGQQHADLDKAYQQLLQYRESLANPPLLIVSDINEIRIHTNFTNTVKQTYRVTLDDLLTPEGLNTLRRAFYDPDSFRAAQTTQAVTEAAAKEFARLAQLLVKWGNDPHVTAKFLIRILFCLFAEDAELLPQDLIKRLAEGARRRPAVFRQQLVPLFQAMTTGGFFGADEILHFNGGLFDNAEMILALDSDALDILIRASALDWSSIEPSIFGTLFERSLDPTKRSQLGAHYTSRDDILLIVEPVLMAPLRQRWAALRQQAADLAAKRAELTGSTPKVTGQRQKLDQQIFGLLNAFRNELAQVQVLDPACGSGNFLYVALRLLLDLEKEVINFAASLGDTIAYPLVRPEQLHGIEINDYAHELAHTTIWIGYIQWLRENGFGKPAEPILKPIENIAQMDAILAYDAEGRPIEPEWPAADVIIGNPPFLGSQKMRRELGDKYVDDLRGLYGTRIPGAADLVTYWFERARTDIATSRSKRAGLLATQGIRGEANRIVLQRIKQTGGIFWAYSDREWILDGAAVHVSMIAFDGGVEKQCLLDDRSVLAIHSNLKGTIDLTKANRLSENHAIAFQGPVKVGAFDIPDQLAQSMLAAYNPHGRSNAEVVKPWMNGSDITTRSRGMWIIDFDELNFEEAALFEIPFEYAKVNIKPVREANRDVQRKTFWWRLGRSGTDLKRATAGAKRMVITPRVSKYRVFIWGPGNLVPDSAVVAIARDDDYFFGVLHSKLHELWARGTGTQLREAESGFRYTPTTTFETYPFPWPPGKEPTADPRVQAIAAAAAELVKQRDNWLNPSDASEAELKTRTLTRLYNQRPTWLDLAHRKLDAAVLDAYGWPHDLSEDEILARLLALNLARSGDQRSSDK
jgi:type II restriction/modification system DNA methylase subunit YeeA